MCLAIPAKVVELRGDTATVDMDGIRREVSVLLVPDIKTGEYAIVHAGFAIGRLDEREALENLKLIREVFGFREQALGSLEKKEEEQKQPEEAEARGRKQGLTRPKKNLETARQRLQKKPGTAG